MITQQIWQNTGSNGSGGGGGNVTGTGTPGQVAFWNGISSIAGDPNFLWDSLLNMLEVNGFMQLDPIAAPVPVTDRLYNVGGNLFWNGIQLDIGPGGADLVSATLATASGAVASTIVNSLGVNFNIPIAAPDALLHFWTFGVNSTNILSIEATGDGAGGILNPNVIANAKLRVGSGAAPTFALDVIGDVRAQAGGRVAFGDDATIGLNAGVDKLWNFADTITDFSSSTAWEIFQGTVQIDSSVNLPATTVNSWKFNAFVPLTNTSDYLYLSNAHYSGGILGTGNVGEFDNFLSIFNHLGVGIVGVANGIKTEVENKGLGTITEINGILVATGNANAGGTVGTNSGIKIFKPQTAGPITTNYGIFLEDMLGVATNTWAIYVTGGNSYFGGNVGFGVAVPVASVDIAGTLKYVDGNQGAAKVLTSDASGNATWQTNVAAAIAIGDPVVGGTPLSVLFIDAGGLLAEDPTNFFYDPATNKLTVTGTIDPTDVIFSGSVAIDPTKYQIGVSSGAGNPLFIQTPSATVSGNSGKAFNVTTGNGAPADAIFTGGLGGIVNITGGIGGVASATLGGGTGGIINITGGAGGDGTATAPSGGGASVNIFAGDPGTNNGGGIGSYGTVVLGVTAGVEFHVTNTGIASLIPDNIVNAFRVTQSVDSYIEIDTLNGSEGIFLGTGAIMPSIVLIGKFTSSIRDNEANAFTVSEAGDPYIQVDTNNGAERVLFGNFAHNPYYAFQGSGTVFFGADLQIVSISTIDPTKYQIGVSAAGANPMYIQTPNGPIVGAAGKALDVRTGDGAIASGGGIPGGAGGLLRYTAGNGGAGSGTDNPGTGGILQFTSGNGGSGTATQPGAKGGLISYLAGSGGTSGGAGAGERGDITYQSWAMTFGAEGYDVNAMTFSTGFGPDGVGSAGGSMTFSCGHGSHASGVGTPGGVGGNLTSQSGPGGNGNGADAAGTGGFLIYRAGPGGSATAMVVGGTGGNATIAGGQGGNGSAAQVGGTGGHLFLQGGSAGTDGGGGAGTDGKIFSQNIHVAQQRFEESKGIDVASANDLTLGVDGNFFVITGNTQINAITIANWQAGSELCLQFTGTPTIKNNTAGGAGTAKIILSGGGDYVIGASGATLTLRYNGTDWREIARTSY